MLVNLYTTRMLTRLFSLEEYAEYSLLLTVALVFSSVVELGSGAILVRYYPSMDERVARQTVTFVSVWGLLLVGVGGLLALLLFPNTLYRALLVLGVLVSNAMFLTTTKVELVRQRVAWYSFMVFLERILIVLGLCLLQVINSFTIRHVLLYISISNFLVSLKYILTYFRPMCVLSELRILKEVYAYGWPLGVSTVLAFAFGMGDRYIVDFYLDRKVVAIYAFAFFVVNAAFQFLISTLNLVGETCFWKLYERHGDERAFEFRRSLENSYVLASIFVLLGLVYSRGLVISLLAKQEYELASELFVYFGIAFILYGLFVLARYKVQIASRNVVVTGSYLVALPVKVVVDVILAPVLGLRGIILGFVAGYVCLYIVLLAWYVFNGGAEWLWNRDLVIIVLIGIALVGLPLSLPSGIALVASIPILVLAFRMRLLSHFTSVAYAYQIAQ